MQHRWKTKFLAEYIRRYNYLNEHFKYSYPLALMHKEN